VDPSKHRTAMLARFIEISCMNNSITHSPNEREANEKDCYGTAWYSHSAGTRSGGLEPLEKPNPDCICDFMLHIFRLTVITRGSST